MNDKQFIIPNGIMPNSVDPLHIDQFNNYFPGQMLYTTPLTITAQGDLSSEVLESFTYDPIKFEIMMKAKSSINYSDGSAITPEDIVVAITRMLHSRPNFPVIRFIKGKDDWLKLKHPLLSFPSGITINNSTISIKLEKNIINPLFRFTMNIMSIIPKRCIDLKTSTIKCDEIPSSGFYKEDQKGDNFISFKIRPELALKKTIPQKIKFYFPKVESTYSSIDTITNDDIVFAYDLDFSKEQYEKITSSYTTNRLAPTWFTGVVLNTEVKPFDNKQVRQYFINQLHEELAKTDMSPRQYSKGIFSKLIPGYIENSQFSPYNVELKDVKKELEKYKDTNFNWVIRKKVAPTFISNVLEKVAKKLNININIKAPEIAPGSHTGRKSYKLDNTILHTTHSGFWDLDPIGDIQMLFTPNMHDDYKDIWSNKSFTAIIKDLGENSDKNLVNAKMKEINQALYDMAIMPILSLQSYTYISKKNKKNVSGNMSLTVPYPWEVF